MRDGRLDGIVAVGGGSAIGLAKALTLAVDVPFLAVPTTYAGSEMTAIYGTTTGAVKTTGIDDRVRPRCVLYDLELTLDLPPGQTAVSGLNAIAHCVESLYGARATPVTEAVALAGLRHLAAGLPSACADGHDRTARAHCLWARTWPASRWPPAQGCTIASAMRSAAARARHTGRSTP